MNPQKTKPDRELTAALRIVDEAAEAIRGSHPRKLTSKEAARLQRRFKTRLQTRSARVKPERISVALAEWESGIRGLPLYQKHIPSYARLSHWRRRQQEARLRNAIYKRRQRQRDKLEAPTSC